MKWLTYWKTFKSYKWPLKYVKEIHGCLHKTFLSLHMLPFWGEYTITLTLFSLDNPHSYIRRLHRRPITIPIRGAPLASSTHHIVLKLSMNSAVASEQHGRRRCVLYFHNPSNWLRSWHTTNAQWLINEWILNFRKRATMWRNYNQEKIGSTLIHQFLSLKRRGRTEPTCIKYIASVRVLFRHFKVCLVPF